MIDGVCAREPEIVDGLRSGDLSGEQRSHIANCPTCSEIEMVVSFLGRQADALNAFVIPDGALVWRRAHRRFEEQAVERATRPIRWVRWAGYVLGLAAVVWLLFGNAERLSWATAFLSFSIQVAHRQSELATGALVAGLSGTLLCLVLGSCYLIWEDRAS